MTRSRITRRTLPEAWFRRPALRVARELLGKYLVRRYRGREFAAIITEVEAYTGPADLASHAARGRRTARTAVMFGPPGRWYVYFTYGMHWLVNIVTGRKGHPAAVLIRGVEGISGPARVAKTFHVAGSFTGIPAHKRSGLWIEDRGIRISKIVRGPRVGVGYAGPVWAKKPYRFMVSRVEPFLFYASPKATPNKLPRRRAHPRP